ncbi:MAG: hypothetical protein ACD_25C00025G0001 [uncultured bacterium]|nr:MAG: hypothetical protein ACD_25C00025G0001 [uncultured bacterium]
MKNIPIYIGSLLIKLVKNTGYFFLYLHDTAYKNVKKAVHGVRRKAKRKIIPGFRIPPAIKNILQVPFIIITSLNNTFKRIRLFLFGVLITILFVFIPYVVRSWFKELPNPEMLTMGQKYGPTQILDRNGVLLYEIYADKKYEPAPLERIPETVVNATIAVEDSLFYIHGGLRPDSILRAFRKTFMDGDKQGGSTITQQLVKNVLLTPERTFSRKIKEAVLSLMVEAKYSKQQILEMYLNNIAYGGNAWGIQSAAQKYFAKNVWELNLAESAMLAGLPSSPSLYSPLNDIAVAKERQKYVLERMVSLGYISREESETALAEELIIVPQKDFIGAPHFVNYVRQVLENMYGSNFVNRGGLKVITTLDYALQQKAEAIVFDEVRKGSKYGFSNGAAVVLDVKNAEILSYVGSYDYFAPVWGAFDVVTSYRQPGSSIKPVTYSLALAGTYTPATIIKDSPVVYKFEGSEPYRPVNYDGKYHGNVTLRAALANSYNIPAVRVAKTVGPDNIVSLGKDMGLTNWKVDGSYGLSITLGGKEVRLIDLANVYTTLARKGAYAELSPIISIRDGRGYEIYSKKQVYPRQVISEEVSYLMWNILSDEQARLPAFGTRNFLSVAGKQVAVKTGTTDLIKDNWTFGFTPGYTVGVWVGNNDNKPMNKYMASGLTGAAPIWNRIMSEVLAGKPNEVFDMPAGGFVKKEEGCNGSEVFIKASNVPKSLCPTEEKNERKD